MPKISIKVDLPDDCPVDRDVINTLVRGKIQEAVAEQQRHRKDVETVKKILESDEFMESYFKKARFPFPVVRARTYQEIGVEQEICTRYGELEKGAEISFHDPYSHDGLCQNDPRRPVVMRGAMQRLSWKLRGSRPGIRNEWCERVLHRYIKMWKITAFTRDEFNEKTSNVTLRMHHKHYLTRGFRDDVRSLKPGECDGDHCVTKERWEDRSGESWWRDDLEDGWDVLIEGKKIHLTLEEIDKLQKNLDAGKAKKLREVKRQMIMASKKYWKNRPVEMPIDTGAIVAKRVLEELSVVCSQREAKAVIHQIINGRR